MSKVDHLIWLDCPDTLRPLERRRENRWGCIFTCLAASVVHLEALASFNTSDLLMAITRYTTREVVTRAQRAVPLPQG